MNESIKLKLFSDVGMNELFMARLFHFQDRILSGLFGGKDNEAIQQAIMTVLFDGLEPAFRSLRSLREKWDDEAIPEKEKIQLAQNVYTYLVVAFKDRFQDVAIKMGYDIGFIFQKQDNFNQGCDNFLKKYPKIDPAFVETMKEDKIWIELMIGVRNNIIDHKVGKDPGFIERLSRFLNLETAEIINMA